MVLQPPCHVRPGRHFNSLKQMSRCCRAAATTICADLCRQVYAQQEPSWRLAACPTLHSVRAAPAHQRPGLRRYRSAFASLARRAVVVGTPIELAEQLAQLTLLATCDELLQGLGHRRLLRLLAADAESHVHSHITTTSLQQPCRQLASSGLFGSQLSSCTMQVAAQAAEPVHSKGSGCAPQMSDA